MKTPHIGLAKIYTNCTGHMAKMATMPIYGKNHILISSSLEPKGQWPWDLVCSIADVGSYPICTNDESRLTLTYFIAMSNLIPNAFIWEKS